MRADLTFRAVREKEKQEIIHKSIIKYVHDRPRSPSICRTAPEVGTCHFNPVLRKKNHTGTVACKCHFIVIAYNSATPDSGSLQSRSS